MRFSIVTPSLRQLDWLKRCVRSVADQTAGGDAGLAVEHIIQDAGTGRELEEWIRANSPAQLFVERDSGMYDALNHGFQHATGEIWAFLNCDEQYLPGALRRVEALFLEHPEIDMVAGDFLIVGSEGNLLSFRRATPLRRAMILSDHLYDFTCALFFRRHVWERIGPFRTDLPAVADAEWVSRAMQSGARARCLRAYLAAFALTGQNLSLHAGKAAEARKLKALTPRWIHLADPILRPVRHFEKLLAGGYRSGPIEYDIFAREENAARTHFRCERPSFRHPWA